MAPGPVVRRRRSAAVKPPYLPHHAHPASHHPPAHGHPKPAHLPPRGSPPDQPLLATSWKARLARFLGRNWARIGYAYRVEPTWLEGNRVTLPVRGLPAAFHGLKVAHLTDFHCGKQIPAGYLEGALERTLAEKPDIIALTGDFIDRGPGYVETAARLFRGLKAPLGVYGV